MYELVKFHLSHRGVVWLSPVVVVTWRISNFVDHDAGVQTAGLVKSTDRLKFFWDGVNGEGIDAIIV